MSETDAVMAIVRAINDAWVAGRYEELERHFHPEVVLAFPGFEQRIEGRGPLIDSYRDFGEKSTLHAFEPGTPQVDRVGPTAIATTSFEIDYELGGARWPPASPTFAGHWKHFWTSADTCWRRASGVRYRSTRRSPIPPPPAARRALRRRAPPGEPSPTSTGRSSSTSTFP